MNNSKPYFIEYRSRERVRARRMDKPFRIGDKDYAAGDYEVEQVIPATNETTERVVLTGMKAADLDARFERSVKVKGG